MVTKWKGGCVCEVLPLQRVGGGGGKSLSHAKSFGVVFTW